MDTNTNKEIGERIKFIRTNIMNIEKQAPFATLIGISRQMLCNIELGNSSLTIETLKSICNKTGVKSDFIVLGTTEDNTPTYYERVRTKFTKYTEEELKNAFKIISEVTSC